MSRRGNNIEYIILLLLANVLIEGFRATVELFELLVEAIKSLIKKIRAKNTEKKKVESIGQKHYERKTNGEEKKDNDLLLGDQVGNPENIQTINDYPEETIVKEKIEDEEIVVEEEVEEKTEIITPEKEIVKPVRSFAKTMTVDEYRQSRQKKEIISGIIQDLSEAVERNQAIDSLSKEVNEVGLSTESIFDWRQNLMEFLVIQRGLGFLKNRYSALQNATFVAGVLIREYLDSSKDKGFFDYVKDRCGEMEFSSPLETFAYGLNADIVARLQSGETPDAISSYAITKSREYEKAQRPQPENLYPLPKTGDVQMDRFANLAIELTRKRLRHLKLRESDVKEAIAELSVDPVRRDYQYFTDYFSHAFQFGYLTEKRFQRLYYLLFNIAQSISLGYTDAQIRHQINNVFVIEGAKKQSTTNESEGRPKRMSSQRVVLEPIPYNEYNDKEHQIVSVAARVSRVHCEHPQFRNTAKFTIDLINQYHRAKTDSTERSFFSISITLLKKQKPQLAVVYSVIASIANHIFDGLSEQQTYLLIRRDFFQKSSFPKQKSSPSKNATAKAERKDAFYKNDLMNAVLACKMRRGESQCLELLRAIGASSGPISPKSTKAHYRKLREALGTYRYSKGFKEVVPVVDYILYCKMNDVPNVSLMALVGTKFPSLYRKA